MILYLNIVLATIMLTLGSTWLYWAKKPKSTWKRVKKSGKSLAAHLVDDWGADAQAEVMGGIWRYTFVDPGKNIFLFNDKGEAVAWVVTGEDERDGIVGPGFLVPAGWTIAVESSFGAALGLGTLGAYTAGMTTVLRVGMRTYTPVQSAAALRTARWANWNRDSDGVTFHGFTGVAVNYPGRNDASWLPASSQPGTLAAIARDTALNAYITGDGTDVAIGSMKLDIIRHLVWSRDSGNSANTRLNYWRCYTYVGTGLRGGHPMYMKFPDTLNKMDIVQGMQASIRAYFGQLIATNDNALLPPLVSALKQWGYSVVATNANGRCVKMVQAYSGSYDSDNSTQENEDLRHDVKRAISTLVATGDANRLAGAARRQAADPGGMRYFTK